jgi:plastocyanin
MKSLLAVTATSLALIAAGCGGDDNGGSSSSSDTASMPAASTAAASSSTPAAAPAGNVAVDIKGFAFDPPDLTVKKGTKVEWENYDSAAHNVVADDGTFKSDSLSKDAKFSYTADKPGTYPYVCTFHANMKGTLTVTD